MSTSVPRTWLAWSSITAAVIGCQALITSGAPQQRLVVMLPSGAEDAPLRQRFLQGFSIGATSVKACGQSMPPVDWQNLRPDDSPLARLPRSSSLQLVVAPPSADVRAFAALSRQQQLSVLFPFQRGPSIDTLSSMDGRERLWPLVPSLRDDLRATAEATLKAGWGRAMVVTDPKALEATVTTEFVDLYQAAGGQVHSYEASPVQQVDPEDSQRLERFRDDMAWSATPTVVVADRPEGQLASRLRQDQHLGAFGGGAPRSPNWVWLSAPDDLQALPEVPWQQLGLEHPARGEAWPGFSAAFSSRWGEAPDLLAASGYDTARVLALVAAAPLPASDEGVRDPMGWVDPDEAPISLCEALKRRRQGESLRLEAAASDFRLRGGATPSGKASAGILKGGSSGRMKGDGDQA